ncbi:MAG: hypothetical protein ACOC9Q_02265 [bacterium]
MTISLTTFERQVRERLLDVIYAQWHDLGVPFSTALSPSDEVIDPEALLWCSLEFFPSEPRLREGVLGWFDAAGQHIIRQRVNRRARNGEPRAGLWHVLSNAKRPQPEPPTEPLHGLESPQQVTTFCEKLAQEWSRVEDAPKEVGRPTASPSTALLWARDLFGSDIRHFLLVYLLANLGEGRLKTVQRWTGYSYRSILETATRWEAAGVLAIDRGYCHLTDLDPWRTLLPQGAERAIIVDWFEVFDACIGLLRALAKAGRKGLTLDSPIVRSHCRRTSEAFSSSVLGAPKRRVPGVEHLRDPIATT